MKKLLTLLLTLLMVFTLVGCGNNGMEEKPVDVPIAEVNEPAQEELVGGFIDAEDGTLTDELKDIFNKAIDGLLGATYEPVELVATQVVAGTNYKFLANGTKTTNSVTKGTYYVTVYEDLSGNVSLLDIETIDEESVDSTQYSYWVVFKNPDGNELQRTIEKYGTIPVYTGDTPVYWDSENWYRFTNWDQELKPIVTNTYITAEYEFGGELIKEETTPETTPAVPCSNKNDLYQVTICDPKPTPNFYIFNAEKWTYNNGSFVTDSPVDDNNKYLPSALDLDEWYHSSDGVNFVRCTDPDHHGASCLAAGTMITMADGSRKPIENLYEGDLIRVFDHNTGKVSSAKIMDYWQYEEPMYGKMTLHFTNNIDVNIVGAHSFFNKQENKYITITSENVNDYIGKQFYNADDACWETLLGVTYSSEPVDTFFIATEDQFDCIAEGMLTMEDGIYTLVADIFDYDANMKVNVFKKYLDILRYGLFTSKDFHIAKEKAIKAYKLQYIKVAIGKGIITKDIWDMMVKELITYESDNINEGYIPSNQKHSAK